MTSIRIDAFDGSGSFDAYLAEPAVAPSAAVIVIQEIFGVNEGIRRKCDALAQAGYLALAPDLFWRLEPGVQLDPDIEPELQRAFGLMSRFDQAASIGDIEAAIRAARARMGGGKVGAVGYCLGGRLAFMTAARTDVDASVGYYGVGLDGLLGEKHAVAKPLLLHIAGDDHLVGKDAQGAIHAGLDDHPRVTIHDYPHEDHGFAAEMGRRRSEEAARLADQRTVDFLAEHLA